MGGIGKTALALHWAYQHLDQFPDGQLYVNLRGFDPSGQSVQAGEAVRGFLAGLGVDPATLPVEVDAQTARYRSLVAGKRMLIVLDNARDIDQITPLLPGSPTCTVLVTSRHHLAGLAALHGAHLLSLDVLPESDARMLLARLLGPERLAAQPQAAADLLAVCAGLPLAIRIVAARAQRHPDFFLSSLAEELREVSVRLDGLDAGGLQVNLRAVLSWSVRTLGPQGAALFGLLGIAPGADISLPAAACLAALSDRQARMALRELEVASLTQQHSPGRYRMHDLIRLYATDTFHQNVASDVRTAALRRIVDFYAHTARNADHLLEPQRPAIPLNLPTSTVQPHPLPDASVALAWLDDEHSALLAAQRTAADHAWYPTVWHLAWALNTFHYRRGRREDQLVVWRLAVDAAAHLPVPTTRIIAHRLLGLAYAELRYREQATEHLYQALALAKEHQEIGQQAHTHRILAWVWERLGDNRQALEHGTHALDLYRAAGQVEWEADALVAMGWFAAQLGKLDTARLHCQSALVLYRHHHRPEGEAHALGNLGYIAHHAGQYSDALVYYKQSLDLLREVGDNYAEALAWDWIGQSHVALDEHEQARTAWREALKLYREHGRDTEAERLQQQLDTLK